MNPHLKTILTLAALAAWLLAACLWLPLFPVTLGLLALAVVYHTLLGSFTEDLW